MMEECENMPCKRVLPPAGIAVDVDRARQVQLWEEPAVSRL